MKTESSKVKAMRSFLIMFKARDVGTPDCGSAACAECPVLALFGTCEIQPACKIADLVKGRSAVIAKAEAWLAEHAEPEKPDWMPALEESIAHWEQNLKHVRTAIVAIGSIKVASDACALCQWKIEQDKTSGKPSIPCHGCPLRPACPTPGSPWQHAQAALRGIGFHKLEAVFKNMLQQLVAARPVQSTTKED